MTDEATPAAADAAAASVLPAGEEFEAFVGAADVVGRTAAFARLIRALRGRTSAAWKDSAFAPFVSALEVPGPRRDRFGAALAALIAETDATNLVSNAGIPGHRGFFSEFGDRLSARLVPQPEDVRDLEALLRHLFRSEAEIVRFGDAPLDVFHRLVSLLQAAPPDGAWRGFQATLADGFRLLLSRVESEGLSYKLRVRSSAGPVSASPFFRVQAAGETLLADWLAGRDVSAALDAVPQGVRRVPQGGPTDSAAPGGVRRQRRHRILARGHRPLPDAHGAGHRDHRDAAGREALARRPPAVAASVRLGARGPQPLAPGVVEPAAARPQIVDRAGETGEHYIARSRREYRLIWLAAAGGGLLTVGTAVVKSIVHGWHLPAGPEGLLYGLNYAVSFVVLQHLGLILATKQPAMTAARLAGVISETEGEDREERARRRRPRA